MDDAGCVHRGEAIEYLRHRVESFTRWERLRLAHAGSKISTRDEIHHNGQPVSLDHEISDTHDVRGVQPRQQSTLRDEPIDDLGILGKFGPEDLHCVSMAMRKSPVVAS